MYKKQDSGTQNKVLLSTGASERNKIMNIYDLAGNVWEWNLKYGSEGESCAVTGGSFEDNGNGDKSAYRDVSNGTSSAAYSIGFRASMY